MTTPNNLPNGSHHQRPHPPPKPRRQRHYLGTPIATPSSSSSSAASFKGCCCYLDGARCDVPRRAARRGDGAGLRAARAHQPPRPDPRKIEYSLCIIELQENKRAYSQDKQKREKKKWGFSKSNHDDNGSFIQMHRQQNIIERILEDVQNEQHQQHRVQQVLPKKAQQSKLPLRKPRTVPNYAHISAIKIQAAYRGYRVLDPTMRPSIKEL
ncbi:hypothetical protein ZIOFF_004087 [Zingiber officinale]|uniref:Uncharacterized protein n=1 Tax=Zingiber officinale TaxID=94328 RepID=A0A8J5MB03_ZINOF|nr:hypothetical protein ZIOFF_004087 [Zingiber officinale]